MKKIKLFFVFSLILFPFLTVTAQTQTIDENNQDDLSILLSNLSFREIENIAKKIADAYLTKQSITEFNHNLTWEDANSIQEKLINILSSSQGELIGYKAALTNKKAQETFKVKEPLLGILLENMLLPSGITIPANFGAKPMIEGDLMVRVASEKINEVTTPQDTLKYLDAVIPFLELPDLVYDKNIKVNAEMLIAINAGARLGVVGEVITIDRENINKDTLKDISVKLIDESGEIIAQGNSNALLGDPLNVVFWIKEQLKAQRKP
ncbi:2-oxo-hepta-3-ene-1,7-dioic acid hydratase [Crocosphaera watsonii WH 0005]|uniref:2-oxo-hepta-3-ene-1,7-dioic acid hydratase n=1 Tax=Crocosphaera watsonii WH 0005 TaxID=423472 RepID=T2ILE3_CROWT|nr:2-oxo-hepta-3-ene-1,7-dioic acid hydratase [Crocosphaera watsonii]CCQ54361.1 2-oxo-hepta-3-ene-1,7-dioic acid hydratase [Crocosphaera watsonii WH 0005]